MCMSHNRQRGLTIIELVMFIVIVGVAAASILQVISLATKNSTDPLRRKQAMLIAESYMEEVMQAHFTFCDVADSNAATATSPTLDSSGTGKDPTLCASAVEDIGPENGNLRPFDNVNDYVPRTTPPSLPNAPVRSFAAPNALGVLVDRDVTGNVLGVNGAGSQIGNSSMDGITTTVMLNLVPPGQPLGPTTGPAPVPPAISSTADPAGLNVLRITITTTYGAGPNDVITLDGYRTRYAPNYTP
jgi:MSHA pilin protein MshD